MGTKIVQMSDVCGRPIRYPLILFFFVAVLSFTITGKMLTYWESRLECGAQAFSGTVIDAGVGILGCPEKGRWQIVLLSDGVPAMLWMNEPGRLGDRVRGVASFKRGEGMRNPGGFSTRLWLWSNGVSHSGQLVNYEIERVEHFVLAIRRLPDAFRDRVRFRLSPFWDNTSGGSLLASLTLGDTSLMSDIERYHLRVSGLSHLTSVSGTHLYFFLAPFHVMTRKISLKRRGRQRVLLALTLIPGVLCGWKSGIARASLSVFMLRLDAILGRRRDSINSLLTVTTCLLLLNPFAIRSQSFWMSLSAAGAIRFVTSSVIERANGAARIGDAKDDDGSEDPSLVGAVILVLCRLAPAIKRVLLISFIAQIAVLPYVLMTSAGFQLLSPLINAVAMPIASLLTAFAYILTTILSLIPVRGHWLLRVGTLFASLLEPGAKLIHQLARQAASLRGAYIPVKWIALILLIVFLGNLLFKKRTRLFRRICVAISILTLGIVITMVWISDRRKEWRVIFLDVGQGDSTLMISPEGYTCLIDGGDCGHGYDTILPVVRLHSLRKIDLAILTHAHGDHASGIVELLECGMIDRLCLPVTSHRSSRMPSENDWESDLTDLLLDTAREAGVTCFSLKAGDRLELGSICADIYYPEEERDNYDLNDDSLVLRFDMDGFKILFTGDLTQEGERLLVCQSRELSADLLHVSHHGSRSSSSVSFLKAVSPSVSVISVGRENRFSHPHMTVLQRLIDVGSDVFRTDRSGALILNIRGGKGTITEWIASFEGGVR